MDVGLGAEEPHARSLAHGLDDGAVTTTLSSARVTRTSSSSTSSRLPGPPSTAVEPEVDRLPGEGVHRDRRGPPRPVDVDGRAATFVKTTTCVPSARLDDRPQRVGRGRVRVVGEHVAEGQPLAGGGRQRRSPATARSSGRRGRWRSPRRPAGSTGHERIGPTGRGVAELLRARARRRCRVRRGRTAPAAGAVSVPSGLTVQPRRDLEVVVEGAAARDARPRPRAPPAGTRPARSRYRTASLFRPVSDAISESSW